MFLEKNGFLVAKNMFQKSEIDFINFNTIKYFKEGNGFIMQPGFAKPDWISDPKLSDIRSIVESKRMQEIVSEMIGEEVCFIERSDLHLNISAQWHKDTLAGNAKQFQINDPWEIVDGNTMKIFNVITYFQDHNQNNDGLEVKVGSHLTENLEFGANYRIKTNAGDSVIFDQRITHRGGYSGGYNRVSISMAYGVKNTFFEQYRKGTIYRQNKQNELKNWRY
jgi:hypothetical protein